MHLFVYFFHYLATVIFVLRGSRLVGIITILMFFFLQEVKIKKDPVHREFKRAKGGERRPKVLLSNYSNLVFITYMYMLSVIFMI